MSGRKYSPQPALPGGPPTFPGEGAFIAGTMMAIFSPSGVQREVAVESLAPGDRLLTLAGPTEEPRQLIALHRLVIDPARHPQGASTIPVRIRANALAPGVPARDLLLAPEAMLRLRDSGPLDAPIGEGEDAGHLVPAGALVNGTSIIHEASAGEATWLIPDLGSHTIMLAETAAVGSARHTRSHGARTSPCTPIRPPGVGLSKLRARLTDRAAEAGIATELRRVRRAHRPPLPAQPSQHSAPNLAPLPAIKSPCPLTVLTGGAEVVLANSLAPLTFCYILPARTGPVRLRARARRLPDAIDPRRFGICVLSILVNDTLVPFDAPAFGPGFHPLEGNDLTSWRWTNGDAWLVLPYSAETRTLVIRISDWHTALAPD